jgi:hypothetical protein
MSPHALPQTVQDSGRELEMLLASRFPLIVIESREERRVLQLVRKASLKARRGRNWGVFQWTVTEGLRRIDVDLGGAQKTVAEPVALLRHLKATPVAGIYALLDFHPYLADPLNVRMIKDIAQGYDSARYGAARPPGDLQRRRADDGGSARRNGGEISLAE